MKNFEKKHNIQILYLDWKEFSDSAFEDLKASLSKLKIYLYSNPITEGNDTYGLVLTKSKITKQQLKDYCAWKHGYRNWKEFADEENI